MSFFNAENYQLPAEPPGGCPETLVWSEVLHVCALECEYPVFSDSQADGLFITISTLACIGFVMCYFYCFTSLLRPIMLKYPHDNIFHMMFCFLMMTTGVLFPLFLGRRYVFCDDIITFASRNWACYFSGFLFYYGLYSFMVWMTIYQFTNLMRIYLIRLPKIWIPIRFIIGYFTWSLWVNIIAIILNETTDKYYWTSFNSLPTCGPFGDNGYLYGIHAVFYLLALLNFIFIILICIRLLYIKKRTRLSFKVMLLKQLRLILFWLYFIAFVTSFVYVTIERQKITEEDLFDGIVDYITCLFEANGNADKCVYSDFTTLPNFESIATMSIVGVFYPIFAFLLFGARKSTFLFWKEYIMYIWKEKTITFQFTPSFDPTFSKSSIQTIEQTKENTGKLQIFSCEEQLQKRINEI